jgi:hypothetical protein
MTTINTKIPNPPRPPRPKRGMRRKRLGKRLNRGRRMMQSST